MSTLRGEIAAAHGLLIGTPEHNRAPPGLLKNVIDWLSGPAPEEILAAKPIAINRASGGPWGTRLAQAALRQVLSSTESLLSPSPMLFVRECTGMFDRSGRLTDEQTRLRLAALPDAFARWIVLVSPGASGLR